jgi:hypothetical protein
MQLDTARDGVTQHRKATTETAGSVKRARTSRHGGAAVTVTSGGAAMGSSIALAPSHVFLKNDWNISKIDRN